MSQYANYACSAMLGTGAGGGGGVIIAPVSTGTSTYEVSGGAAGMYYEYNGCDLFCPAGTPSNPTDDKDLNPSWAEPRPVGYVPASPTNLPQNFTNWCAEAGDDGIITSPLTVSIDNIETDETIIFTSGSKLHIETLKVCEVTIYNSIGQQVYQQNIDGSTSIDTNLHGIYFVKVDSESGSQTKKVVIK